MNRLLVPEAGANEEDLAPLIKPSIKTFIVLPSNTPATWCQMPVETVVLLVRVSKLTVLARVMNFSLAALVSRSE